MSTSKTWPGGATGASPTAYSIPAAGELNWAALSDFLVALADGAQSTVFQKFAIRQATTSPVTVSASTDCVVVTNLGTPGAVAVTLPAGQNKLIFFVVDGKGDATTNNITITPNGAETIAGAATLVLGANREAVMLAFNSTTSDWSIVARSTGSGVGLINPMSGVGDMIYGGTAGAATRLAAGSANKMLQANGPGAVTWVNLVNANVDAAAAIAGTKISPVFGSQDLSVGSTAFFVDNTNKRAYIGATSSDAGATVGTYLAITGSTALGNSNQISNVRYDSTASEGPVLNFARSKSGTLGTKTVVVADDSLGGIAFRGIDVTTTGVFATAASIASFCDGTVASSQVPGRIVFSTANSSGSVTEAGRVEKAQRWTLGRSSSFSGNIIYGVTDLTSQTAGQVGEYKSAAAAGSTAVGTSGNYVTILTLPLTAGDWDVSGVSRLDLGTGTVQTSWDLVVSLNTTSRDDGATGGFVRNVIVPASLTSYITVTGSRRISINTNTNVYLIGSVGYTAAGSMAFDLVANVSFIQARRMR